MCMNPAEAKKLHKTDDDKMYICSREIVSKVGYLLGVTTSVLKTIGWTKLISMN